MAWLIWQDFSADLRRKKDEIFERCWIGYEFGFWVSFNGASRRALLSAMVEEENRKRQNWRRRRQRILLHVLREEPPLSFLTMKPLEVSRPDNLVRHEPQPHTDTEEEEE